MRQIQLSKMRTAVSQDDSIGQYGFTIIEVIVALVIVSIVGAVFMARLGGANSFNGIVVRDQIVSLARMAQQSAFGRAGVELTVEPNVAGSEAIITATSDNGQLQRVVVPTTELLLSGDRDEMDSCGTTPGGETINNANPFAIKFGRLGDVIASSGVASDSGDVEQTLRVCINNNPDLSVCISASGYAYAGDCDQ